MTIGISHLVKAAIRKETTWGTGVNADNAAADRIPIIGETLTPSYEKARFNEMKGVGGSFPDYQTGKLVSGSLDCLCSIDKDTEGFEMLLALAMGAVSWRAGESCNRYTVDDELDAGYHATISIDKQVSMWNFIGCKINGFTLSVNSDRLLQISFDILGYDWDVDNTILGGSLATTPFSNINNTVLTPWKLKDFTFRIGDTDNILTSDDDIEVSDFTISFDRKLSGHEFPSATTNSIEPKESDRRDVSIDFTLPRYDSDTLFTEFGEDDLLQILVFAQDVGANNEDFYIYLPAVKLRNPSNPASGTGLLVPSFSADCFLATKSENNYMVFLDGTTKVGNDTNPRDIAIEINSQRTSAPI